MFSTWLGGKDETFEGRYVTFNLFCICQINFSISILSPNSNTEAENQYQSTQKFSPPPPACQRGGLSSWEPYAGPGHCKGDGHGPPVPLVCVLCLCCSSARVTLIPATGTLQFWFSLSCFWVPHRGIFLLHLNHTTH